MESSDVNRKSGSSFELPKISDWASFSGHFQMAMIEAISANKKRDSDGLEQDAQAPQANAHPQKRVVKSVKWNLPNQPMGNFGRKLVNINRATFATNIQVTSSLPRAKLVFPLIRKPPPPKILVAIENPEPTVTFADSEQVSKELRPRSAHELSHARANRLHKEELEKYNGKYCNRLDVKFRGRPSPKFPEHDAKANNTKLPVIICQDLSLVENSKDAPQLTETKCMNWLHSYFNYFK